MLFLDCSKETTRKSALVRDFGWLRWLCLITLAAVSGWCVEPFAPARLSSGWADAMPGSPGAAGTGTADWGEEDINTWSAKRRFYSSSFV